MAQTTGYRSKTAFDGIEVETEYWLDDDQTPHPLDKVRVRWGEDGSLTIKVRHGGPAQLDRCYLEGKDRDVILRLRPAE